MNHVDQWLQSVNREIISAVDLSENAIDFACQFNKLAGEKIVGNWPSVNVTMPSMLNKLFEYVDWNNSSVGYVSDHDDSDIEVVFSLYFDLARGMDPEDGVELGMWLCDAIYSLLSPTVYSIECRDVGVKALEIKVLCDINNGKES